MKLLYLEMLYGPIIKRQQSGTIKFCGPVTPIVGMHIVLLASHGSNSMYDNLESSGGKGKKFDDIYHYIR